MKKIIVNAATAAAIRKTATTTVAGTFAFAAARRLWEKKMKLEAELRRPVSIEEVRNAL